MLIDVYKIMLKVKIFCHRWSALTTTTDDLDESLAVVSNCATSRLGLVSVLGVNVSSPSLAWFTNCLTASVKVIMRWVAQIYLPGCQAITPSAYLVVKRKLAKAWNVLGPFDEYQQLLLQRVADINDRCNLLLQYISVTYWWRDLKQTFSDMVHLQQDKQNTI